MVFRQRIAIVGGGLAPACRAAVERSTAHRLLPILRPVAWGDRPPLRRRCLPGLEGIRA